MVAKYNTLIGVLSNSTQKKPAKLAFLSIVNCYLSFSLQLAKSGLTCGTELILHSSPFIQLFN